MDIKKFVKSHVIMRDNSLLQGDLKINDKLLYEKLLGKSVLVIGGAGSIGSAFIKEILHYKVASLVVVDINENGLTELTRDLRSSGNYNIPDDFRTYPINYADAVFEKIFLSNGGFDIVANFSAHKHVRSEKDVFSVEALLRNNVINAQKLLDILSKIPPEAYFCVSTDKAANPVNIMGMSKRIMEDLIFSYSDRFPVKTARFANVAFSNGSLPDGFLHRIEKKQPISAPKDVKRFFVSPEESGQICMLACILGDNREIFFPKLSNEQMEKFDDIARKLLNEMGYEIIECESEKMAIELASKLQAGSNKYPVYFSKSDTSGEKMYEEFYVENEYIKLDKFESLGIIIDKEIPDRAQLKTLIEKLIYAFDNNAAKSDIVEILQGYYPEFNHIETGKSLDQKM